MKDCELKALIKSLVNDVMCDYNNPEDISDDVFVNEILKDCYQVVLYAKEKSRKIKKR